MDRVLWGDMRAELRKVPEGSVEHLGPYLLGPNDTPENGIYTGDARELAKAIPDESVDLIFTDPVYWQHNDYEWLAMLGARVLVEGGNLIAQAGNPDIPKLLPLMEKHLAYNRILCEKFPVATQAYRDAMCFVGWKPHL